MEQVAIAPGAPQVKSLVNLLLANIIIEYGNPPSITETAIDFQPFPFEKAKAAKQIIVEVNASTKTRYYLGIRHGNKYESLHIKPEGCEGLKFYEQPMIKRNTGERFNYYFFVASKKQGVKAMEEYIKRVVAKVFNWTEDLEEFKVIIWNGKDYRQLQSIG